MADSGPESEGEFASAESDSETPSLDSPPPKTAPVVTTDNEKTTSEINQPLKESTTVSEGEQEYSTSDQLPETTDNVIMESQTDTQTSSEAHSHVGAEPETESVDPPQTHSDTAQTETDPVAESSGWGWGWSNISSAWSKSVSAVTGSAAAQVISKGLGNVVSGVEETLGIPSPQEMIRGDETDVDVKSEECPSANDEIKISSDDDTPTTAAAAGLGGFFSGIASAVQTTGINIVSGGLDALEVIGRKTVDIISEGDPGLRKKRAMLSGEVSSLSQLLREAKEKAAAAAASSDQPSGATSTDETPPMISYYILFEQYQGLVYLEALELLSSECSKKLEAEYSNDETLKEQLDTLCQYFNMEENETDDEESLTDITQLLSNFNDRVKTDKLLQASKETRSILEEKSETESSVESDHTVLYEAGLHGLAKMCSLSIELLRKTAEVTLLPEIDQLDLKREAENLHKVTNIISVEFESLVSAFAEKITDKSTTEASDEVNANVTSLYLEASNSSTYLQSAFKLVLPVLQVKLMQTIKNNQ